MSLSCRPLDLSHRRGPGGGLGPGPGEAAISRARDYGLEDYEDYLVTGDYADPLPPCPERTTVQPPFESTTCIDYFYGLVTACSKPNGHDETKKRSIQQARTPHVQLDQKGSKLAVKQPVPVVAEQFRDNNVQMDLEGNVLHIKPSAGNTQQ